MHSYMKLAILGLGFMGTTHLKALRHVPDAQLVAVASDEEAQLSGDLSGVAGNVGAPGERFDFSGVRKYRDIESALADRGVEAVDICLPTHLHAAVAIEALRAGKHVLVEKPMALDAPSAGRMVEEARRHDRILMAAHVLRFFPAYQALRALLESGRMGLVRSAVFRRRCGAPGWCRWLGDAGKSGGGVFDLLIHDVDICLHLFGRPDEMTATGYEDLPNGVDVLNAQLFYSHGGVVVVTGGWHHPGRYPFSMEYTVTADGGTAEYSSTGSTPTFYSGAGTAEPLRLGDRDGYAAEIEYFVECCRTGRRPALCPPEESADAVRLTRLLLEARNLNGERISCALWKTSKSA